MDSYPKGLGAAPFKELKMTAGRPTLYTEELAEKICGAIASNSLSLDKLSAKLEWFPTKHTIFAWRRQHKEFSHQYAQAKREQIETLVDEILDIADTQALDSTIDDHGNAVPDNEYIQRSRLRIDTRKWLASKLMPKIYGERVLTEITSAEEKTLSEMSTDELKKELKRVNEQLEKLE